MFRLFENLSDEITLKIFSDTSRRDQASLAKTCKKFNEIANDVSLKLFKYKSGNFLVQVGNVHTVVKKTGENKYEIFTTHNGQRVINSGMRIAQKSFGELVEKEGTFSFIEKLKTFGLNGRISARALELEHNRITRNDSLKSFKSNPENLVVQIGDAAFVVEKISEDFYEQFTFQNGQIESMINTTEVRKKHFDEYFEKAKEGVFSLIENLKNGGVSDRNHASVLEKAQLEEQKITRRI